MNWKVADEIVIATTGNKLSQKESETRTINAITDDGKTITLDEKLKYKHLSMTIHEAGRDIELCGEVGLLSHNVKVQGNVNEGWNDEIAACDEGFNPGEFAIQTCFQGRFGEEIGSDEFGAQIMIHPSRKDKGDVTARISYIEVNFAGQAFRLGRYPIHFHLLGDVNYTSYVRGCGIHKTFNRAVNIHGTHRVLVEHTVIYNIMGGAFFLEDGIETGNIFQYNLAVFVKSSTSLLNDDITPAAFWVTNPNNIVRHNHAAGGTHFGFWYRMHKHPDGPSFDKTILPQNVPLGKFENNTVHSQGWFGLWIFQNYAPRKNGKEEPAKFETLITWHCEKGMESVVGSAIQAIDHTAMGNEKTGIEFKFARSASQYKSYGDLMTNSLLIAQVKGLDYKMKHGIVLPQDFFLLVTNVTFVGFNESDQTVFELTQVQGTCSSLCSGFKPRFSGLSFMHSPNKQKFKWQHEIVLRDIDGSLTGTAGAQVIPKSPLVPSTCTMSPEFSVGSPSVEGYICTNNEVFIRMGVNHAHPRILRFKTLQYTDVSNNVVTTTPFRDKGKPIDPNPAISAHVVYPQSGHIRPEKWPFFQNFQHFSKLETSKKY